MAIGLGRMFGFRFPENFRHPYIATSVQDFWRRWHISLSTWFRDYLYVPLGGSRRTPARTYLNLVIVFRSAASGTARAGRSSCGASSTAPSWSASGWWPLGPSSVAVRHPAGAALARSAASTRCSS